MIGYRLVSAIGLVVLTAFGWVFSTHRRVINWRCLAWGLGLQLVLGAFVFRVPAGARLFLVLNDLVFRVLEAASSGAQFVFGRLALSPGQTNTAGETSLGFILATQAFPTIIFFSALMSLLYFLGVVPWVIRLFARLFARTMRVSGAEALCTASNVFVGIESMLIIRPHLETMTLSELTTVLTAGLATIASSVLGFYALCLQAQFPQIAGHLISASLLSAPAALMLSKILWPETEQPRTLGVRVEVPRGPERGVLEAILNGANDGLRLVLGIVALLVAVLGLVSLVDMALGWVGGHINRLTGWGMSWALKDWLGYAAYPFTVLMGVPWPDVPVVARIVGERTIVTELVGYQDLAQALASNALAFPGRSAVIAAYALCGFAHVASVSIFVGGACTLAPSRIRDIMRVAPRALLAATLACLITGCIAGLFTSGEASLQAATF